MNQWIVALLVLLAAPAFADEIEDLDQLLGQFGWDVGVLIVDDQFPASIPKVKVSDSLGFLDRVYTSLAKKQ